MSDRPIKTPATPDEQDPGRSKKWFRNAAILVVIAVFAVSFVRAEQRRRQTEKRLQETTIQLEEIKKAAPGGNQELAKQVLEKVRKHMTIAESPAPTVATIIDVEKLRAVSEFYASAKNGDHLIITEKRAILYDPEKDIILDVVPIRLNRTESPSPGVSPGTSPRASSPSPVSSPAASPPAE